MFLTASLETGATTTAVRIRNLSPHGALIDGSSLPPVGSQIRLRRGQLQATGQLAWQSAGQGGVNFAKDIDVELWVKRVGHGGQQQVDGVIAALRGSGELPFEIEAPTGLNTVVEVSRALDQACDELAATPDISIELGEKLLRLDSIAQTLRRLATGKPF